MQRFLNSSFNIGSLQLPNRLIQGPLAGFSCAPFRQLYYQFLPPAYCVSEMISAYDVLHKHQTNSRYLFRAPEEKRLCYQLAGHDPYIMAQASQQLEAMGADIIDINSGCPKAKIRKKKAGSALMDDPLQLCAIISAMRQAITIPLTVKIRIYGDDRDLNLAKAIEQAGADALIVHGRRWTTDYDTPSDIRHLGKIKHAVRIPVIANGDIADASSLADAIAYSGCDAYMISRAGCGHPWLYQALLTGTVMSDKALRRRCFMDHLQGLSQLESEFQAVLQSKTLVRYYFGKNIPSQKLNEFYALQRLLDIENYLTQLEDATAAINP